jgi:uncharacterized protein with PQ loop repeat
MDAIIVIGLIAALFTTALVSRSLSKMWKTKSTKDISTGFSRSSLAECFSGSFTES